MPALNQDKKLIPVSSPIKGVNSVVNREGQPPDTCWSALNMLPYDRYGRKRVSQRAGITAPFPSFVGGGFIQNLTVANEIYYPASVIGGTPGYGIPAFTLPQLVGPGSSPVFFWTPTGANGVIGPLNFSVPFSATFTGGSGGGSLGGNVGFALYGTAVYASINALTQGGVGYIQIGAVIAVPGLSSASSFFPVGTSGGSPSNVTTVSGSLIGTYFFNQALATGLPGGTVTASVQISHISANFTPTTPLVTGTRTPTAQTIAGTGFSSLTGILASASGPQGTGPSLSASSLG